MVRPILKFINYEVQDMNYKQRFKLRRASEEKNKFLLHSPLVIRVQIEPLFCDLNLYLKIHDSMSR
jgi:hypothetical protein